MHVVEYTFKADQQVVRSIPGTGETERTGEVVRNTLTKTIVMNEPYGNMIELGWMVLEDEFTNLERIGTSEPIKAWKIIDVRYR